MWAGYRKLVLECSLLVLVPVLRNGQDELGRELSNTVLLSSKKDEI
jgi:hypothetical protein